MTRQRAIEMEVAPVPAKNLFTRIIPVALVASGLVFASPASADAAAAKTKTKTAKSSKKVVAKIALGDKRKSKSKVTAAKAKKSTKVQAKATVACSNTTITPDNTNLELVRSTLLCLHNQIRAEKGLPALKDNGKLRKAAAGHNDDMVVDGFFDHTSPDGDTFVDRIIGAGYAKRNDGWTIGENLAWGTGELSTPQAIMNAWMNSAGHKANILKKSYKEVGIAIRLGVPSDAGVGATVTADFGARV